MLLLQPVKLELPWPPSVNHYTKICRNRIILTPQAREYKKTIELLSIKNKWPQNCEGRLSATIEVHPPDKRQRDLDNLFKMILDALQAANVYANDNQFDLLISRRLKPFNNGLIHFTLGTYDTSLFSECLC